MRKSFWMVYGPVQTLHVQSVLRLHLVYFGGHGLSVY